MKYKIVYSRTTWPNWANFGTKHSLVNGILVDYKEIAKKKTIDEIQKYVFCRTTGPISTKLVWSNVCEGNTLFFINKGLFNSHKGDNEFSFLNEMVYL